MARLLFIIQVLKTSSALYIRHHNTNQTSIAKQKSTEINYIL